MSSLPRRQGSQESQASATQVARLAHESDPRLRGSVRLIVRSVWVILVALNLVSFITGIPDLYATVTRVCAGECAFSPQQRQALANIHLSMDAYATIFVALACVVAVAALVQEAMEPTDISLWLSDQPSRGVEGVRE